VGNRASVIPCPVTNAVTVQAPVNTQDPAYPAALKQFLTDPYRTSEWAGDKYDLNMQLVCGIQWHNQDPVIRARYDRARGTLVVTVDEFYTDPYCDLMGTSTKQIFAEVQKRGSRAGKQVGHSVVHVDGMREMLAWYYQMPERYARQKATISGVGDLCRYGKRSRKRVVIRLVARFAADQTQTFQSMYGPVFSGSKGFKIDPLRVCQ
jgi:hypothetical protein